MNRAGQPVSAEGRVLVLAPGGRDADLAVAILKEAGISGVSCGDLPALVRSLADDDAAAAIVTEEALASPDLHDLAAWVADQPPWSDLGFIVLTRRGGGPVRDWGAARLSPVLRNITFLERPFHPTTLVSTVKSALAARQRQHEARRALAAEAVAAERLRRVQRIGRVGGFETDIRTDTNYRSADYMSIHGLPAREATERHQDWVGRLHSGDRGRAEQHILDVLSDPALEHYAQDYRIVTPAGDVRWISARAEIERDAAGRAILMRGAHVDVTELKTAEHALRESEERLRMAQEAGDIGAWEFDLATGRRHWSESNYRLWGIEPGTPLTIDLIYSVVHPDDRSRARAAVLDAAQTVGPIPELEIRIVRPSDGAVRWVLSRAESVTDESGRPVRQIGIMRDITKEKQALERLDLIMREVDHRAKNVLAVAQSLIRLTVESNPHEYMSAIEGRIAALARAHTLLAHDQWEGGDLRAVIQEELAAYQGADQIILNGPTVRLRPDAVQPLAMTLHELATNAAKHGALSTPEGRLTLTWSLSARDGSLQLLWQETGGPPISSPPERRGFGSTLIEGAVRSALGGELGLVWRKEGLSCTLTIDAGMLGSAPPTAEPEIESIVVQKEAPRAVSPVDESNARPIRRILVAEDEPIVAMEIVRSLGALGWTVVGPAGSVDDALRLAVDSEELDAAFLDYNLRGKPAVSVGDALSRRGVPIIWATGYGEMDGMQAGVRKSVVLSKPVPKGALEAALLQVTATHRQPDEQAG